MAKALYLALFSCSESRNVASLPRYLTVAGCSILILSQLHSSHYLKVQLPKLQQYEPYGHQHFQSLDTDSKFLCSALRSGFGCNHANTSSAS